MRTDPVDRRTTREEGTKTEARDLGHRGQKVSSAHRSEAQAEDEAAPLDKVRSQDPNFGRGHH